MLEVKKKNNIKTNVHKSRKISSNNKQEIQRDEGNMEGECNARKRTLKCAGREDIEVKISAALLFNKFHLGILYYIKQSALSNEGRCIFSTECGEWCANHHGKGGCGGAAVPLMQVRGYSRNVELGQEFVICSGCRQ